MNASVVERVAERMEELEAKLALTEATLRDVKQLARAALVDIAVETEAAQRHEMASTLNAISTRIAAAQQALRVTDDAEHKRGHEKDDAEILAWVNGHREAGFTIDPAMMLKFIAARRRQSLRAHGEELLRLNAADPTLARANEPENK